jgi:hypothetical protein
MIVCYRDIDKTNDPYLLKHTFQVAGRPRQPIPLTYIDNEEDTRIPSPPLNVVARIHPLNDTIFITWDAPINPGTSAVIGYRISHSDSTPFAVYTTLIANTSSDSLSFEDTLSDVNAAGAYILYAINGAGESIASSPGYYRSILDTNSYLVESQTGYYIVTGADEYIIE